MNKIYKDRGHSLAEYADIVFVECPKCQSCAKILIEDINQKYPIWSSRKLVCTNCCHQEFTPANQHTYRSGFDMFFKYPLWFKTSCSKGLFWALNAKHLQAIEDYITSDIRKRIPNKNESLVSRLPKWIKEKKIRRLSKNA